MERFLRIAYSLMFGAWAALVAWVVLDPLLSFAGVDFKAQAYMGALADGAVVGLFVGAVIGAFEKYNSTSSVGQGALGCGIGLFIGMLGGALGLVLANFLYQSISASPDIKQAVLVVGWMIFGIAVGLAPGIAAWSPWKLLASTLGGCMGGLLGGAVLLALATFLRLPWASRAAGFVALALVVGALIAAVQQALKRATLKITAQRLAPGIRPLEGMSFDIFDRKTSIGSRGDNWVIGNDQQVLPHHVEIRQEGGKFVLHSMIATSPARVNNQPVQAHPLNDGDRFWIGGTEIAFKARR